ncbi:hypothetical protein [Sporolactobacillus nakayamae]|uniref:Holin n=1 Tax=Sporolactobacillus nakayamae TaxID=269670 RepID=A0A1I2QN92_9BACL|nr:hypothetical protein [Sporolactobacillus nakayamae]SFG29440.1 hypothetical protein SAMN02982927_01288 [Sporolactobacillus nakayamae]
MFQLVVIVALVTGLGQVMKQYVPSKIMPAISLAIGLAAGFTFTAGTIQEHIFNGIAIGLAASGLFDVSKIPVKNKN